MTKKNNKAARDRVAKESGDLVNDRLTRLRELFPEAILEGKVDFGQLRSALGDDVDTRPERYSFTWAGKRDAIRLLQAPSHATLVPSPKESISFDDTGHVFIEGDNLETLKLLYKSYFGRVKMVYIDPPYNTGGDFVYPDDFADPLDRYLKLTGQKNGNGDLLTTNPETNGRFHSAWLSMMYPRLFVARQLLREEGVICVSIGEEEIANLRLILNEIFGEENYRNTLLVRRYDKNLNRQFIERGLKSMNVGAEYVVIYARSDYFTFNPVYRAASEQRQNFGYWKGFWNPPNRPTMRYPLLGVTPETGQWKWKKEVAYEAVKNLEEYEKAASSSMTLEEYWEKTGKTKRFIRRSNGMAKNQGVEHWIPPSSGILRSSNWTDILASETLTSLGLEFDQPKNIVLLKELVRMCADEADFVFDFFAGSCTTAHAVLELNREDGGQRRFVMVQLPEPTRRKKEDGTYEETPAYKAGFKTIAEIGKERIRRVIKKLKDATNGKLAVETREAPEDLGFKVFKLAASNYRPWTGPEEKDPEAYAKQLALYADPLMDGWKPENLIWEVAIKEGYGLTAKIEKVAGLKHNAIYHVTDPDKAQSFRVCLEDTLHADDVKRLNLTKDDLFICRDKALDDEKAANLALQCRLKAI